MAIAFTALLVVVLIASVISFVVMGLLQHRRTYALGRTAHEKSMRFSPEDPFDVSRRYANFALIGGGHSPRAANVTYGRVGQVGVRVFDFCYELGHGTRRITRRCNVVVVEADFDIPPVLLWSDRDAALGPLAARRRSGHVRCWSYSGRSAVAATVADACSSLAGRAVSIETKGSTLMISGPASRGRDGYIVRPEQVPPIIDSLRGFLPAGGNEAAPSEDAHSGAELLNLDVENSHGS